MDRYFVVETPLPNCNKGWKFSPPLSLINPMS